jgi:hypothetical protein
MDNYASDGYSPGSNVDLWSNAVPAKTMAVMALIAAAVGDAANATFFRKAADDLSASINAHMFDREKGCYVDGLLTATNHTALHSTVFPLDFGITPASDRASCVQSMLAKFNESAGLLPAGYGAWRSFIRGLYASSAELPAAPQKALEFLTQKTGSVGKRGYGCESYSTDTLIHTNFWHYFPAPRRRSLLKFEYQLCLQIGTRSTT